MPGTGGVMGSEPLRCVRSVDGWPSLADFHIRVVSHFDSGYILQSQLEQRLYDVFIGLI